MTNQNPKANAIRSIMNNPKLLKIVKDGLSAPLGSTKRTKARSILSASNKIRNNYYSGQGGGVYYGPQTGSMTNLLQPAGMANQMNMTYNQPTTTPQYPMTPVAQSKPITPAPNLTVQPAPAGNQLLTVQPAIPQNRAIVTGIPSPLTPAPTTPVAPTEQGIVPPYGSTPEGLVQWKEEKPEEFQQYYNIVDSIATPLASNEREAGYPSALWDDAVAAVSKSIGKETFLTQALPKLKTYFPSVPEEEIPVGAVLTENGLSQLKNRISEEIGLNTKLANLQKLQNDGVSIESDLQTFIRSKDQFLTSVNQMFDNADKIWTGGDPVLEGIKSKYQKFLYIQKARQNQKYDNYVKTSIAEYDTKLKILTSEYNTVYDEFKTRLAEEKDLTKDRYNYYKNLIEDLYDNLENREKAVNDKNNVTIEGINNKQEMADQAIISSGNIPLSVSDKNNSLNNYIIINSDKSPDVAANEWKNLSDNEKRMYVKKETDVSKDDVMFYVTQIGTSKKGQDTAYVDENGNIKWASIPQDLRPLVLNKLKELAAQQQKNTTPGSSIWNKLSKIIGGGLGQPLSIFGIPLIKNK